MLLEARQLQRSRHIRMQVTIRIKYNGTLRNGIGRSEASRMGGEWNGMEWDRNVLLFGFSVVAFDDSTTVKL